MYVCVCVIYVHNTYLLVKDRNTALDRSPELEPQYNVETEVCDDMTEIQPEVHDYRHGRVYLPAVGIEGVSQEEGLRR